MASTAFAKTQYVTDVLYVTLREGAGDDFKIIKVLRSGVKMEILQEGDKDGFSFVRTEAGDEGWIRNRYLVDEPIARIKLETIEQQTSKISEENDSLKQEVTKYKKAVIEADKETKRLSSKNQSLEMENQKLKEISAKPIELAKKNQELTQKNKQIEQELQQLQAESSRASESSNRNWFLTGGGVLLAGLILGLVLPNLKLRRRKDWA